MTQVPSATREITVGQLAERSGVTISVLHCGCLSLTDCQLANPDDLLGASGAGPRRLSAQPSSAQPASTPPLSAQPGHGQGGGQQDDGP
jgi:hypothetical protein